MKRLALFFLALILCFTTYFNVYSINIDGYDKGAEWDGAETQVILNGESNCKVNFGLVKWILEPETNNIYLCAMFKDPELKSDNSNTGVSLQIDNSDPFIVTVGSSPNQFDIDKYYFDGAVSVDNNNGATCEMRIGIKFGLPENIDCKIRFYDSEGSPSNVYYFTIKNTSATEEYHDIYNDSFYENNYTYSTVKHTAETTDKKSTTSATVKSTTKRNNSTKNSFDILDLLIPEKTSTAPVVHSENKSKTETLKTTKKTVKETKSETTAVSTTTVSSSTETTFEETTVLTTAENIPTNNPKLDAYKVITLVAGGISLVAISVLGTLKAKKQDNNDNSSDTA